MKEFAALVVKHIAIQQTAAIKIKKPKAQKSVS